MSSKTKIVIGLVIAAVLVIGGCNFAMRKAGEVITGKMIENATGGKAKVDTKDGSMTVTTSEGTMTTSGKVPDGWPTDVPVYAGSTVQFSGSNNAASGETGLALVLSTTDDSAKVVDYYKTTLKAAGWTVGNTMEARGSTIMLLTKGTQALSLAIASTDRSTSITMGLQDKAK